jgi:pimeloyl-ACP methyl ester carboxylesterase
MMNRGIRRIAAAPHMSMLGTFTRCFPSLSGAGAYDRFCTPHLSAHRSPDHHALTERARFHLREAQMTRVPTSQGEVQTYVFEPGGTIQASVLMVHGWTGEASFMSAFAEHFRRRGFRSVLYDFPAHGLSTGKRTSLIACAHTVREIAEAFGPIHFVVAHSLGGMAALLAGSGGPPMPRPYPFQAYALIAMPNRFADVTSRFGADLGLSPAAQRSYEQRLERLAQRRIVDFTGVNLLREAGRPALLLHARDDAEVPFRNSEEIVAAYREATLHPVDDLGHRKILYAPPVVRAAAAFLTSHLPPRGSDPTT